MLTLCWPKLPLSCPYVDPMFTDAGLGNALPHSSDRNDGGGNGVGRGWGGGDDGVGTARSAAGAAALITFGYYRRPPARTRAGPGAGARIEGLPPMPPTPIKQGSMDRAKGFTHIPQEIKNGNHHASIHAVHFGNLDPGKCRNFCTFGTLQARIERS